MKIFDFAKPRTAKAAARARERAIMEQMGRLLEIQDEETLRKALKEDFGIEAGHERYERILSVWRGQR